MVYQHEPLINTRIAVIMPIARILNLIDHGLTMVIPMTAAIGTTTIGKDHNVMHMIFPLLICFSVSFVCSAIKDASALCALTFQQLLKTNAV